MTTWYELRDDGTIGRSTESKTVAGALGLTLTTEKKIVYGWDGRRYFDGEQPELPEEEVNRREIARLKDELAATDYKIIKCSECSLAGATLPYDVAELHAERQALRDRINELGG